MAINHVRLIGAFDRYNYGDLLLALATARALRRAGFDGTVEAVSTRARDLRARGVPEALPTRSFSEVRRASSPALHLVPGGEVLSANWVDTLASLLPPRAAWWLKASARLPALGPLLETGLARGLAESHDLPWVHDAARWGGPVEAAYFAVGGLPSTLPRRARAQVLERLETASFRCARDSATLAELGTQTLLAPDLVSLLPTLVEEGELAPHLARLRGRFPRGWLTFQINRRQARHHLPQLGASLGRLAEELGCAVLLLPLGRAARHEDQVPLGALEQQLKMQVEDLLLVHERSLYLAIASIAGSRLFLGTSLHGNLTAMAYRVPWVAVGDGVAKLDRFVATWTGGTQAPVPCADIGAAATRALEGSKQERGQLADHLASSTRAAFDELLKVLS